MVTAFDYLQALPGNACRDKLLLEKSARQQHMRVLAEVLVAPPGLRNSGLKARRFAIAVAGLALGQPGEQGDIQKSGMLRLRVSRGSGQLPPIQEITAS